MAGPDKHASARDRRAIAIKSLGSNLDAHDPVSAVSRFRTQVAEWAGQELRPLAISGDIDGIVSAAMLASVLPNWRVVAVVGDAKAPNVIRVHPAFKDRPQGLFGVDLFSLEFDNIGNHIQFYGSRKWQQPLTLDAMNRWDGHVRALVETRLFIVPNIWANIEASYQDGEHPRSAKFKYPLGTAQLMLALLEASGLAPKFFDRRYLPWLVANCDGGVSSLATHAYADNVGLWWSTMAAAVGPGSLSEMIYRLVSEMRPRDFDSAVDTLSRELATDGPQFLDDRWNLQAGGPSVWMPAIQWLCSLTGWPDPIFGGCEALDTWLDMSAEPGSGGVIKLDAKAWEKTDDHYASLMEGAWKAVNANFRMGGNPGDRFNWVSGWPATSTL